VAITEDTGNQPVPTHPTTTSTTSASFSPQANTLLVALFAVDGATGTATSVVVSDSKSGAWTLLKRQNTTSGTGGSAEVWCQYLPTAPGSMTVSGTWAATGQPAGNMTIRCLLGAAPVQPGATGGTGGGSVAATATLTPTRFGSRVYGANVNYFTNETMTANANTSLIDSFIDSGNGDTWSTFKGLADTSSLVSTAYGFTHSVSQFNTAAAEILAATVAPVIIGQAVGRASTW
jgi:hypothetical protein